eukprot:6213349-Pleurochrysis_carterae.AAC.2
MQTTKSELVAAQAGLPPGAISNMPSNGQGCFNKSTVSSNSWTWLARVMASRPRCVCAQPQSLEIIAALGQTPPTLLYLTS